MNRIQRFLCYISCVLQLFTGSVSARIIDSMPVCQFGYGTLTTNAVISPDEKYFLTGSYDGRARLWDVKTGALVRTYTGHKAPITAVAFSPDGKFILTGANDNNSKAIWRNVDDNKVRLWNTQTGECTGVYDGNSLGIRAVAFSPDGNTIAAASEFGDVMLWNLQNGKMIKNEDVYHSEAGINSIAFTPDGAGLLTGASDSTVCLWNTTTCDTIWKIKIIAQDIRSVAFSPDAATFITGSYYGNVSMFNTGNKKLIKQFVGHCSTVFSVRFSPDGKSIMSCGRYGVNYSNSVNAVVLWDTTTREASKVLPVNGVQSAVFLSDGNTIMTSCGDNRVRFYNISTHTCDRTFNVGLSSVRAVAFSPDGSTILSGYFEDEIAMLWDVKTGTSIRSFEGHTSSVEAVAYSPDGATILTCSLDSTARLWNTATGECIKTFKGHTGSVCSAVFSPDGKRIATGSADKTAKLWDIANGECIRTFTGHTSTINTVSFSPDGNTVVTGGYEDTMRLYNIATGECIKKIKERNRNIVSVAFSPNGSNILAGTFNDTAHLWDIATGACVQKYFINDSLNNAVFSVAFSPDGKSVLTGMTEHTVRLWNTSTGECIEEFIGNKETIHSVAFSPDGHSVIAGSADGTVLLWNISGTSKVVDIGHAAQTTAHCRLDIKNKALLLFTAEEAIPVSSTITLYQISGRQIFTKTISRCDRGIISIYLDKPLPQGIYTYKIFINGKKDIISGSVSVALY